MHSRGAAAKAAVFACAIAAFAMAAATATVGDCTYTDPEGRKYDFSPLIANNGSYTWTQDSYEVGGKDIYTVSPGDVVTYTYELQVCGNVKASSSAACSSPSPINRISADGKTCDKMGDLGVSSFYQNPFKDGAYLSLWGGDDVDHIHKWQSRIYFQCNPNATEPRPYFEHSTDYNQAHFKFYTNLAC